MNLNYGNQMIKTSSMNSIFQVTNLKKISEGEPGLRCFVIL